MPMSPTVIAYIPVIHKGYLRWLEKYGFDANVFVLGSDVLQMFEHLRKDIRALDPEQVVTLLKKLGFTRAQVVSTLDIERIIKTAQKLSMPDEDVMHELAERYGVGQTIHFDSVFLRWDKRRSLAEVTIEAQETISQDEFDQAMIAEAQELATKSADWWRQVGAVVVKDMKVVGTAFNHHVPHPHMPYFDGDPRGNFHKGEHIDKSTAFHAEAALIAQAAEKGQSLAGASLYVTTFPCPPCAKLVAYSGIKKLYFHEGYAMVDGEKILKDNGVEIIRVQST